VDSAHYMRETWFVQSVAGSRECGKRCDRVIRPVSLSRHLRSRRKLRDGRGAKGSMDSIGVSHIMKRPITWLS
jgi:hypothetical protein